MDLMRFKAEMGSRSQNAEKWPKTSILHAKRIFLLPLAYVYHSALLNPVISAEKVPFLAKMGS